MVFFEVSAASSAEKCHTLDRTIPCDLTASAAVYSSNVGPRSGSMLYDNIVQGFGLVFDGKHMERRLM